MQEQHFTLGLIIAAFCHCTVVVAFDEIPEPRELESRYLNARSGIVSGTIHLQLAYEHFGQKTKFENETVFAFDGEKIRFDNVSHVFDRTGNPAGSKQVIRGRNCIEPQFELEFCQSRDLVDSNRGVILSAPGLATPGWIPDPRTIGYFPTTLANLGACSVKDLVGGFETGGPVEKDELAGENVWRISYTTVRNVRKSSWIAPEKGYNPVRVSWESGSVQDIVTSNLKFHAEHNLWFPDQVTVETFKNGTVAARETLKFVEVELNKTPDSQLFTLAGMDIPPGTRIVRLTSGKTTEFDTVESVWDGTKELDPKIFHQQQEYRANRFRIAVSAGIASAVGLCIYVVFRFSSRRSRNDSKRSLQ